MNFPSVIYCKNLKVGDDPYPILEDLIKNLGGIPTNLYSGDQVLIKPNFVAPLKKSTTDLRFIDFFISKIREIGAIPVIGESSGFEFDTEATFEILGIKKFAKEREVSLINLEKEAYTEIHLSNIGPVQISNLALKAKLIINLPVLKRHRVTIITGAVKNLLGFLSKESRRHLHSHRLEEGIRALGNYFKNTLHILDARSIILSAVFGQSQPFGYCISGFDPFAIDHLGAKLIGLNPKSVKYLKEVNEYQVKGSITTDFLLQERPSMSSSIYKTLNAILYWLDELKCSFFGGNSILPLLHWHFGLHPEIGKVDRKELLQLSSLCPIGAIDPERARIIKEKCINVRCLKCYHSSKKGMIRLRGISSYREKR